MEDNKQEKTEQYLLMLKAFEEAIYLIGEENEYDVWTIIGVLSEIRAKYLFGIVADNLLLSYEYAIDIVKNNIDKGKDEVTDNRALVLLSALDNILDFVIGEEYTMFTEMPPEFDDVEDVEDVFEKYNWRYANIENDVVEQAAMVAFTWMHLDSQYLIQYTTQRDERVRVSHAMIDGLMFPKDDFPEELIPPVDYGCRCFLVNTGEMDSDKSSLGNLAWVSMVNPVFKESLAKGGRIFSDHTYLDIPEEHQDNVGEIKERILELWLT